MSDLNASAVKKLKVPELRSELTKRGLDTKGLKQVLVDRLLSALEDTKVDEIATEAKEEPEPEPLVESEPPATEEKAVEEAVVEDEQEMTDVSIGQVSAEVPSEIMADDSVPDNDTNVDEKAGEEAKDEVEETTAEKAEVDEEQATQSEEKPEVAMESDDKEANVKDEEKAETADTTGEATQDESMVADEKEEAIATDSGIEDKHETPSKEYVNSEIEIEDEKDETDENSVVLSRYISDLYFKISSNGLTGSVIGAEGFSYVWGGAKMIWGVQKGKVSYECKVLRNIENDLPDTEVPKNGVRVGWSSTDASLQLGEDSISYGFDSSGKSCTASNFSDYGVSFTEGDVIGCYLDLEGDEKTVSYTKNGEDLGVAFTIAADDLQEKVLFPHIFLKNTECEINAGALEEPWFPCKEGFTLLEQVEREDLVVGQRGYYKKDDCEVIMMVGLPSSGKTTWVNNHLSEKKEKQYNVIGTNLLMERMKINGEERKRTSEEFDKLMDKATKCLKKLFDLAPTRKRNYILDQTNVHPSAQRRKMEPFRGFKRTAVVLVSKADELEKRAKEKREKDGFEIPEYALADMKANFTLPRVGSLFDEVAYVDEDEDEAQKIVNDYKRYGKPTSRQPYNRQRRDDYKSSDRYHPYRRDGHNRSHSGGDGRDFRRYSGGGGGGRGGGGGYGRQHGGSHDRNQNRGGYNKGHYQGSGYSRGGGRAGGSGGGSGGGYQRNSPQQRYGAYPQYNYSQPQVYGQQYGSYPGYQQARTAYGAYQQPQYYTPPQQGYYPTYSPQYGRRY